MIWSVRGGFVRLGVNNEVHRSLAVVIGLLNQFGFSHPIAKSGDLSIRTATFDRASTSGTSDSMARGIGFGSAGLRAPIIAL
jgi:hypothetical protein